MLRQAEPRRYVETITPWALIQTFMLAYVARLSGLRAVCESCGRQLQTDNFSSLSHALRRRAALALVKLLVGRLETSHVPGREELVPVDGMAYTLPKTRRHRCKKFNDKTVGGGVVWAFMVNAAAGVCPVKVLKVIEGAWCDSKVMRTVALLARGPVYVMDRGFYALDVLEKWLSEGVRFVIRVRERSLRYEVITQAGRRRRMGNKTIVLDAVARLGVASAKSRPVVRLVIAELPSGEKLILASDRMGWSAERILEAYRQRWHIERFHRFLKDALGLAHAYSFHQGGMMFLLHTALLLSLLLLLAEPGRAETIMRLRQSLKALRGPLGLGTPWRRNSCVRVRARGNE